MTAEQPVRQRIGFKLFVLLASLILLCIAPLTYVVFSTVSYFGNYSVAVNREQIKDLAYASLQTIAREQAQKYETFFSRVATASSLMAAQAKDVYENLELYKYHSSGELLLTRIEKNGMYATSPAQEVVSMYWGGEHITEDVSRELQALTQLDSVMKRAKSDLFESHAAHMITVSGIGRYHTDKEEAVEAVYNLPPASEFDLRDGEPLTIFSRTDEVEEKARWTRVYKDDVISGLMITASSPVVDSSGTLRAIMGIDVPLNNIVIDLLRVDSSTGNSGILFSFLLDQSGRIIAFPQQYLEFFGVDINWNKFRYSSDILECNLADSSRQGVAEIVPRLLNSMSDTVEIELDSEQYLLTMHAMPSLGWHLVLVNRETQLISSVARTEEALSGTIHLLGQKFFVNVLFILLFVIVAVFFAVRHFVSPLQKLSEAALRVGEGNLKTRCYIDRDDELGIMANSFNDMVRRLESAERIQKKHAKQLELAVEEQTRDLRKKNFELEDIIAELNVESERRKRAVEALKMSEEQLRTTMDASLAGLCIVQELGLKYINPQLSKIFGYDAEELTGDFEPLDLIVPDARETARQSWIKWLTGESTSPYVIPCIRKDGTVFDALLGGDLTVWQGKPALVATFVDISEQKKTEEQLRESKQMLQDSLAEKEVLMREIYHRTKNNMLVIISMLNLQALDIEDAGVKELFKETENRIRAMSLAHEKLYQSQNLSEVDLAVYLRDMVRSLVDTMVFGKRIRVEVAAGDQVVVSLDNIVPLGLAVNEIVTNSIKHAFPQNGSGTIFVRLLRQADDMVEVQVGDDGIGLPDHINPHRVHSLGLQITVNLIEKQLHGTLDLNRENGTMFIIKFKEMARPKRI